MIPRRLCLQGFMCYREKTEISFKGSSIWALSGKNGEGKSTIFDAMRYALYGKHRLGEQHDEELIHRDVDSFMIEFDFGIGENEYRVKRTYSRKKKSTRLAMHLNGPDAPIPGRNGTQPISGTEDSKEFEKWILRTIGLDEKAFTVSVLLLQGQSDALLKLKGAARHQLLTQIINLSCYESLCKLATAKQKEQEYLLKSLLSQLNDLAEVDEASVLDLEGQVKEAKRRKEEARLRQLTLAGLKEQAKQWQKLQDDIQQLAKQVAAWVTLLEQAEQIDARASRLALLQTVVPLLTKIYDQQGQCTTFKEQIERDRQAVQMIGDSLHEQGEKLDATQEQLNELRKQRDEADYKRNALQPRLLELSAACTEITRLSNQQQKYRALDQEIAKFTPDLEQQRQNLQANLAELTAIEEALPHLKQFASARSRWQSASRDLVEAERELRSREELLAETGKQKSLLQEQVRTISEQLGDWRSEVATKKTLLKEWAKHLERFQDIDGQPTCSYCGQILTPGHLKTERQRIEAELQEAQRVYQSVCTQYTATDDQRKALTEEFDRLSLQAESQQQAVKQYERQRNTTKSARDEANVQATTVLPMLPVAYIAHIQGTANAPIDFQVCLQAVYPTPQDLAVADSQLHDKPLLEAQLSAVLKEVDKRARLVNTRDYVLGEIQPLEQKYPSEQAAALLEEQEQRLARNEVLRASLKNLDDALLQQNQQFQRLEEERQQIEQRKSRFERSIVIAETNLRNAQQAIQEICDTLPAEWLKLAEALSQPLLDSWKQEMTDLAGATERLRDLHNAQQHYTYDQQALESLRVESEGIPAAARQDPAQLEVLIQEANLTYQTFDQQEREVSTEVYRLKNIQNRHQELEQQRTKAAHLASSYKDLARLLGRDGLQGFLVQKAEEGIVYHANEILDRISGGALRLALRPSTDRKGGELDMVAYNTAISTSESQPIQLLSGSQQFRVSVSLALGIGRYAGNENHRVESAIIDEGFGSLDENGRREMIRAIKELGEELKCIIVVSHQREFFDEFPNRYFVELVDGSTQVSLK